jgi:galactokinase
VPAASANAVERPLAAELVRAFAERFGPGPAPRLFFAPGRVNLMGAHLDYNGGPVMPTAIDRGTFIAARPAPQGRVRLESLLEDARFEGRLPSGSSSEGPAWPGAASGRWFDYPLGVLRQAQAAGQLQGGLELLFGGNLPIGAGLSSSASICVGTALAVEALAGPAASGGGPERWVEQALAAERGFVGVRCGIMDPNAVARSRAGHLLWLDCLDGTLEHLPFPSASVAIGICDSGVRRDLAAGAFNQRVAEAQALLRLLEPDEQRARCLRQVPVERFEAQRGRIDPLLERRGAHVFGELARTFRARELLAAGRFQEFGGLLTATHASLRERYEVSTPELDLLVELAVGQAGVWGSRLTGAGFGGCTVLLGEPGSEAEVGAAIAAGFAARFGRAPGVRFYRGDPGPRELLL